MKMGPSVFGSYVIFNNPCVVISNINPVVGDPRVLSRGEWDENEFIHLMTHGFVGSLVWEVRFHPVVPDYLLSTADDGNLLIWDFHSPNSIHTQYSGKERLATHKLLHSPL